MCGRYAASANPEDLTEIFEVDVDATDRRYRSVLKNPQQPPPGSPDYNMAPTKQAPVVLSREPGVRQLRLLTWGLVPTWAKDPSVGIRAINARSESLLQKSTFTTAARRRRCLVPAAGWYEWQVSPSALDSKGKPRKHPFFISRADEATVAFAGVYDFWKDPAADPEAGDSAWLVTFSILTTAAEPGLDRIHDRQPVVLEPDRWSDWLDPEAQQDDDVQAVLADAPAGRFQAWPVSSAVNGPRHHERELIDPVAPPAGAVDPVTGEVWE